MLGARILQTGSGKKGDKAQGGFNGLLSRLKDPNSILSRGLLFFQAASFFCGLLLQNFVEDQDINAFYIVTILLAHSLLRYALLSLRALRISVHVLMSIALVGALSLGQFREAATVALLVSASEWIVGRANASVEVALESSLVGTATHATLLSKAGGSRSCGVSVKIEELCVGDVFLLKPGEEVPTDGRVIRSDRLMVDEASVTGEAMPAEKPKGSLVVSGTVVQSGSAEVECTATSANSFSGRLKDAVDEARGSRSDTEELVNKFATIYTPIIVIGSMLIVAVTGDLSRGLTALVSACPCAMVAAAPVVQACAFVRLLSDLQVLVKNAKSLEALAQLTTLASDKTGTLTQGEFSVADKKVLPVGANFEEQELYRLLAALESKDSHPLAGCLVEIYVGCAASFSARGGIAGLPNVEKFTRVESMGVWGMVDGRIIGAGSASFLEAMAIDLPQEASDVIRAWEASGGAFTPVFMSIDDDVVLALRLEDEIRPDAAAAVKALQELNINVAMLTGDGKRAADLVAARLNIQEVHSKLKPVDKEAWIRSHQQQSPDGSAANSARTSPQDLEAPLIPDTRSNQSRGGNRQVIGMIGDGLNDGPALAAANVGIAISSGLQLTADAADIVIGGGGATLHRFVEAIRLARSCRFLVVQNLVVAAFVKFSALLLAATGHLQLSLGVLSDSGTLLLVILNSLRPLFWKITSFE
eukprot:TRINITY_DN16511_c2_g1_i1.p1 TRINITY_DN16511_c2_g1~~TRINITY_DN16511_c2_g1_i1.p1  ORF type:complete len:703 (-),score=151.21 TRINITY_DN16511_c2_g1_i1:607-2715(-)